MNFHFPEALAKLKLAQHCHIMAACVPFFWLYTFLYGYAKKAIFNHLIKYFLQSQNHFEIRKQIGSNETK